MKVAFIDTVHPCLQEALTAKGFRCDDLTAMDREKLMEVIGTYDGIVIRSRITLNQSFLERCTALKFIARSGAGMENIDLDFATQRGVQCFNAPEGNRDAVGEQAIGMLLMLFNRLAQGNVQVRQGLWDREGNRGVELGGKTIGIIGYGNNGSAFAKKLAGFDVKVLAYDKYRQGFGNDMVEEATMEAIFDQADVLSFHIPQTEETIHLLDEAYLNKFRKPIYVINLARGKVVKTSALAAALKTGQVLGACLDVLEYEKASFEHIGEGQLPEAMQYLIQSNNVILSPHVGGWTHESYYKLSKVLADKVLAAFG